MSFEKIENGNQTTFDTVMERSYHSEQPLDMVTQFDERVAEMKEFIEIEMQPFKWAVKSAHLLDDMQAHIRKQNALLLEAALDLGEEAENRYPKEQRDKYPSYKIHYDRDMEIVSRIRKEVKI